MLSDGGTNRIQKFSTTAPEPEPEPEATPVPIDPLPIGIALLVVALCVLNRKVRISK